MSSAEIRTHSAVHVLKGAVQKVLRAKWTASVHVQSDHGRLTVQFARKPSEEEIKLIESEANNRIDGNADIIEFEMEREEAEGHFGKAIYDLFPIPQDVKRLKIVRIPDWEINCCVEKHVESTSEIGRIRIDGVRFRPVKQLLEIEFHLTT